MSLRGLFNELKESIILACERKDFSGAISVAERNGMRQRAEESRDYIRLTYQTVGDRELVKFYFSSYGYDTSRPDPKDNQVFSLSYRDLDGNTEYYEHEYSD